MIDYLSSLAGEGETFLIVKQKPKGEAFTSEKEGWFLSDLYVKEVMDAKVQ
jgi:hypothetical protein